MGATLSETTFAPWETTETGCRNLHLRSYLQLSVFTKGGLPLWGLLRSQKEEEGRCRSVLTNLYGPVLAQLNTTN